MTRHRLALFDCDGTLADSQHEIVTAMNEAFAACGLDSPPAHFVRSIIGLSVPRAVRTLAPHLDPDRQDRLGDAYRDAYFAARTAAGAQPEPLYDGIVPMLDQLTADGWLLGIATGKSQRGLIRLLTAHGILDRFVTLQTADFHPSKPDPAMVHAALAETGCAAQSTVVIGDTSFDMAMARAAGAEALGVVWGYHDPAELSAHGARMVADQVADLPSLLLSLMERPA